MLQSKSAKHYVVFFTDELLLEAQRFKKIAHKTEKKMMWKNVKV